MSVILVCGSLVVNCQNSAHIRLLGFTLKKKKVYVKLNARATVKCNFIKCWQMCWHKLLYISIKWLDYLITCVAESKWSGSLLVINVIFYFCCPCKQFFCTYVTVLLGVITAYSVLLETRTIVSSLQFTIIFVVSFFILFFVQYISKGTTLFICYIDVKLCYGN